jgi:prophage regulatory protein
MSKILRLQEVLNRTGLSKSAIYEQIHQGQFPKQIKIAPRTVGWLESEVNDWLTDRIAERDRA